jgi:pimeloyl-ACP methyl ester carboxylesterase
LTDLARFFTELERWADARPAERRRYGPHADNEADLYLPEGTPRGTVVLLHGGFWRAKWTRAIMVAPAADLARRGFAVWNVEYRRVGAGGGVPETLEDVEAAVRALCPGADAVAVGHSAGGHLALWLAGRGLVRGAVAVAGVCDLGEAVRRHLGDGAATDFLGAARLEEADPIARAPAGIPTVLVHGREDDVVPVDLSRRYAAAAGTELVELPGVGHFEVVDPRADAWAAVADAVERLAS